MDKNDKLAHSRKKLKKFREKMAARKSPGKQKIPETSDVTPPDEAELEMSQNSQQDDDDGGREFLEEQIKAHAQTVDILVSEKSSLQKEISDLCSQLNESKEAHASCQLYLQSARNRQSELEREKEALEEKVTQVEREVRQLTVQNSQLLSEATLLRSSADDADQQREELISKLRAQQLEHQQVQRRCTQLEVELRQKGVVGSVDSGGERASVEVQKWKEECDKLNVAVQRLSADKKELVEQVAALKEQQEQQRCDLESSIVEANAENEERSKRIEELESLLNAAHADKVSSVEKLSLDHSAVLEDLQVKVKDVEEEKLQFSGQLQQQLAANLDLSQTIAQQQSQIEALEDRIQRLSSDTVDQTALLDTIQQDKEALSRSVLQNKELKAQLSELQEEFVKMSHKNMEYASDLETEHYGKRKLQELVNEQNTQMVSLNCQLEALRQELEKRRLEGDGREKEERHEAEGNGIVKGDEILVVQETTDGQSTEDEDIVKQTMKTLEMERNSLAMQLQAALAEREDLGHQLMQLSSEKDSLTQQLQSISAPVQETTGETNDNYMVQTMYQELLTNFSSLQDRFTKVISQNADLTDKLQEYEHITIQLEGENSTIAEYIDLYHKRRRDLKEKFMEKDAFISKLLQEKEALKAHLQQLQMAAEDFVHTPHSPTTDSNQAHTLREDSTEDLEGTDFEEEDESRRKLRTILENLPGRQSGATDQPILVPCPCCTGEVINL